MPYALIIVEREPKGGEGKYWTKMGFLSRVSESGKSPVIIPLVRFSLRFSRRQKVSYDCEVVATGRARRGG